jgi:outer membrane protein assembly factor BamB
MFAKRVGRQLVIIGVLIVVLAAIVADAADQPQWGELHSRNMVSNETGLPTTFDPKNNDHILWSASVGHHGYSSAPIIAEGKVFIGSNNAEPRDPKHKGDRGVLLCLNEKDGSLCWQMVIPRITENYRMDWPEIALCSPPTVEGDRLYVLTNRYEVACLDMAGLANGNDGPFKDEGRHMTPQDEPAMEPGPTDADILWLFDIPSQIGIYMHDAAFSSILSDGPYLYLNTCNGVDNPSHEFVQRPDAASLIVLDKKTGALVAKEGEGMAKRMFHSTWSSPALGEVNGKKLVFFAGPDGVCYAFKALPPEVPKEVQPLETVWKFDTDPTAPKQDFKKYVKNIKEGPSDILSMPVFVGGRVYLTGGGDIWWGKRQAWLKCVDATQEGDVTKSAELWSYPLGEHVLATPAVYNGMVFVGDCAGVLHCVDAENGKALWTHEVGKEIWGACLVADGKVYVGDRDGTFAVFAAEKTKNLLATIKFDEEIISAPIAANGVLYISTLSHLYAVK